ncbi:hypothetical protein P154DRAFT_587440 [Amniculicola lignicola CBS 123094]|uniref:Fungal N-terminal domain-containing protein n=1 Tax=Amniculicola lignicola CBS 123094 TaxID=1392246 RepID=A0A6A5VWZ9_9PLEO|nr:hypothetical protein P154DRAFT_587440 [Amniculicola lignicola CBS 123094]
MSFGFSAGDIAIFTKFITTVVDALKDEGGSRFEYQSAVKQCQDVLDLMDEVARLNFSRTSQSLRTRLGEQLESTKSIVDDFKTLIARYEKSMGKFSKRNKATSAARKVQWAFDAAEDLSKFQPRLSAQLHMVQIVLQMGVWNFLNVTSQSDRLLVAPRRTPLLENGQVTSHQLPHNWNRGLLDQHQMQGLATQITDLIYQRLAMPPSVAMAGPGRAFTLPDGEANMMSVQAQPGTLSHENTALDPSTASSSLLVPYEEGGNALTPGHRVGSTSRAQHKPKASLAEEINEHLNELNLEGLSDAELRGLDQLAFPPLLLEGSEGMLVGESARPDRQGTQNHNINEPYSESRSRFRPKFSALGHEPVAVIGVVAAVFHLVQFASKLAISATVLHRETKWVPAEIHTFARRVNQYSQLLTVVGEAIMGAMDNEGLQSLTDQLLYETQAAFSAAAKVFGRYMDSDTRPIISAAMLRYSWKNDRKEIARIIDEIEALKPSLIIILQTLQIRAQSRTDSK